jgi:hypothetical protein
MISCLNCAEPTDNHAICDRCFAAAERGAMHKRAKGKLPRCPRCGYTKVDALIHGDHRLCGGSIPNPEEHKEGG